MRILLCLFRRLRQPQPPDTPRKRGQVIVIFAVTLLAMLFFAGLAIDSGMLYVTYGHLRRAIDGAAVAAANDFKSEGAGVTAPPINRMTAAALEVMKLHDLSETDMDLKVYVCDRDGIDGTDSDLLSIQPEFYAQCPDTASGESARKLVWVEAKLEAPLYFLYLLGFRSVPLRATAIAEAAPIDLVIVIDTSESMASETTEYLEAMADGLPFDPGSCNSTNTCEPMAKAKAAANGLIETMFDGFDHVAIVHYDVTAPELMYIPMRTSLADAKSDVDALQVHDDPPYTKLRPKWFYIHKSGVEMQGYNPVYPEDRDGNGYDSDPGVSCTMTTTEEIDERWDDDNNPFSLVENGVPCDLGDKFDAYDWDGDAKYTDNDDTLARAYLLGKGCDLSNPSTCKPLYTYFSPNSTCIGCGIRAAADVLKRDGRPNSVWVIVFLSDGLVNMSDTPATNPNVPATFPNGYCNGGIGSDAWGNGCLDLAKRNDITVGTYKDFGNKRHCMDTTASTCPPGSDWVDPSGSNTHLYTVYDYALDMIDYAGLNISTNAGETGVSGSDTAIYAIGLGSAGSTPSGASGPIGEYLLRYMGGQIGDDNDRATNECEGVASMTDCGQYYYAPDGAGLRRIFNDISTRIYSRLTK